MPIAGSTNLLAPTVSDERERERRSAVCPAIL